MSEAGRTHHPAPELEELVRSDDLQFKLFIYKYSVFGIMTEHADGDNTEYRIQNTEYRIQNTEYRMENASIASSAIERV